MRLGLQTKLLGPATILIVVVTALLIFVTTVRQREMFQNSFKARGLTLAQALETSIGSRKELEDLERLQSSIYKLIWLDPELVKIDINVPTPEGLQIVASNDTGVIGTLADPENNFSFGQDTIRIRTLHQPDAPSILSVITPIHVGGQRVGTYDIRLSLEAEEKAIGDQQRQLILIIMVAIAFAIPSSLFLKGAVLNPILELREGSEKIRAGNLDWQITPRSKDEIGDLAEGFNEMARELKESHITLEERVRARTKELERAKSELEEVKSILEVRVQARTRELSTLVKEREETIKERTKELYERVKELERFQKLTVGRELKMIELKEEIKKLKQELKSRGSS